MEANKKDWELHEKAEPICVTLIGLVDGIGSTESLFQLQDCIKTDKKGKEIEMGTWEVIVKKLKEEETHDGL